MHGRIANFKLLKEKHGRFPVMLMLGTACAALLCNQTIGAILQNQLADSLYDDTEAERTARMLDIENSVILVSGLVPWCIACSVPRAMLDVGPGMLPLAFYLWLVPVWWLLRNKSKS